MRGFQRECRKQVSMEQTCFVAKGDYNSKKDSEIVSSENYLGKVTSVSNSHHYFDFSRKRIKYLNKLLFIVSLSNTKNFFRNFFLRCVHNFSLYSLFLSVFSEKQKPEPYRFHNADFLVNLVRLHNEGKDLTDCGWDFKTKPVSQKDLTSQMKLNKLRYFFSHLSLCKTCQLYFGSKLVGVFINEERKNFIRTVYLDSHRHLIHRLIENNQFHCIEAKYRSKLSMGLDIDYLISSTDFLKFATLLYVNGFKFKQKYLHEVHFIDKKHCLEVDAHFLSSSPRDSIFPNVKMKRLTSELLLDMGLTPELLLFSSIVRFWTNDLHRGIRGLYDLVEFIRVRQINWKRFFQIAEKYQFSNEAVFSLMTAENIFGFTFIPKWYLKIFFRFRISFLAHFFSNEKLTYFEAQEYWGDENNFWTKRYVLELFLLQKLLYLPIHSILIRPRILFMMITCFRNFVISMFKRN